MDIAPFELERWFAEYEHDADIMLAESGIRSLDASRFDLDVGELGYVIPTNGDPSLRAAVADRYDRSQDEVLFTCGAQEANFLAFQALLDADDHAVVVTPTYQALHAVPESICDVTTVDLNVGGDVTAAELEVEGDATAARREPLEWTLDLDAVADAIQPNTRVVVLNNPNNPTGRYHDETLVRDLYDLAAENDAYLLSDEVYRLLADDPITPVAAMGEYGVSTASVTKSHGLAGLRFGWLVATEDVVDAAWGWKDYTTISPGKIDQHVAAQALEQETEILAENRALVAEHRSIVADWVADHGLEWFEPVGVNAFLPVPDGFAGSREFCRTVVEDVGVVLAPGDCFGFDGFFRLGFGLPTDELEAGLGRVGDVIDAHRQ